MLSKTIFISLIIAQASLFFFPPLLAARSIWNSRARDQISSAFATYAAAAAMPDP